MELYNFVQGRGRGGGGGGGETAISHSTLRAYMHVYRRKGALIPRLNLRSFTFASAPELCTSTRTLQFCPELELNAGSSRHPLFSRSYQCLAHKLDNGPAKYDWGETIGGGFPNCGSSLCSRLRGDKIICTSLIGRRRPRGLTGWSEVIWFPGGGLGGKLGKILQLEIPHCVA